MKTRPLIVCLSLSTLAFVTPFFVSAHSLNPEVVEKITGQPAPQETAAKVDPRGEERTLASFPEWYIVYSAQEYASFVKGGGRPSQFPYFAATRQYWDSVGHIKTALGATTIDDNTQTVLNVIGVSFAVENALIGFYEDTVGRTFEMTNFYVKTAEDVYTERVADEYGQFLLHTPWYEFPYFQKLGGLWSTYGLSSITPRGIERRIAFTVGYSIKGAYGYVLGKLSKSTLGSAQLETTFVVSNISVPDLGSIDGVHMEATYPDGHIRARAPRYRAFTHTIQTLVERGAQFVDIQEHQKIMLTVLAPTDTTCLAEIPALFAMPILTEVNRSRIALAVPMSELSPTITRIQSCNLTLEHVYDY